MSDAPLFQDADEQERIYAPQQVPEKQRQVIADEGSIKNNNTEPPAAAPVANVGTSTSGMAAPPNIGDEDRGGAPGDPQTEARDPLTDRE